MKSKTPNPDICSSFYSCTDGLVGLEEIANKIYDRDAEFYRLVRELRIAHDHLLVHLNAKYHWD